jgi:acyl-CoA synthetase (AMP-forming)/AMP-acid ligase II
MPSASPSRHPWLRKRRPSSREWAPQELCTTPRRSYGCREELFAFCRERLAPHKTPRFWEFVDQFPLTPSGKVQKFLLRDGFVARARQQLTVVEAGGVAGKEG